MELQKLLGEVQDQLGKLPAPPSDDAQGEIILLVSGFARELATYVEGTPDDHGIHQLIRPLNNAFLEEIRSTAQRFSPFERNTEFNQVYPEIETLSCSSQISGGAGRVPFTHPGFLTSDVEPVIYNGDVDTICVEDVMEMADG